MNHHPMKTKSVQVFLILALLSLWLSYLLLRTEIETYHCLLFSITKLIGIHVHADDAMVNVNLWITPDDANLNPSSGGLVLYTVKPPRDWDFKRFNANWEYVDEHLLRPSGYSNVTIPYKQNRAVIFDSFLFHKTDRHKFKQGYENRRINLTWLYGEKQSMDSSTENYSVNADMNFVEEL